MLSKADGASLVYADDRLIGRRDSYVAPHFKTDWNSEQFRHFDYLTRTCILRVGLSDLAALGDTRDWARSRTARAVEQGAPIHLHEVLHRLARPAPRMSLWADLPSVGDPIRPPVWLYRSGEGRRAMIG